MEQDNSFKRSKWKWIAHYCKEKELKISAELAMAIELLLESIYGNTTTEAWSKLIKMDDICNCIPPNLDELEDIAQDRSLCIGCQITPFPNKVEKCSICEFGKIAGICSSDNSLFALFLAVLSREWEYIGKE